MFGLLYQLCILMCVSSPSHLNTCLSYILLKMFAVRKLCFWLILDLICWLDYMVLFCTIFIRLNNYIVLAFVSGDGSKTAEYWTLRGSE